MHKMMFYIFYYREAVYEVIFSGSPDLEHFTKRSI